MKLTKTEKDILMHRLEVPECIYESLGRGDVLNDDPDFDKAWLSLERQVRGGQLDAENLTELEKKIMGDCIDCSTWFHALDYESQQKKAACQKVGWDIIHKFEQAGIPVDRKLVMI